MAHSSRVDHRHLLVPCLGLGLALGIVVIGLGRDLRAGSVPASGTANLSVSANVSRNCTITTTPVAFGAYDAIGVNATTPLDAAGSVSVACTKGSTVTIGLGLGNNALVSVRRMTANSEYLTYEMYLDTTRLTVWGTSGVGLLDTGAAPSKNARSFPVYGRVPIGQDVAVGSFVDTLVATVNF